MQFATCYKTDVEGIMQKAQLAVWGCAAVSCIVALVIFFKGEQKEEEVTQLLIPAPFLERPYVLEDIGKGALALHPAKKSSLIPDLSREIFVLAKNSRPDCDPKEAFLLISTKSSNDQRVVAPGEQIFLKSRKNKAEELSYSFSDKKTALWIRPMVTGSDDVCFEVGMFSPSKQEEGFFEEVSQVIIQHVKAAVAKEKRESSFLSSLSQAKWWGRDRLFDQYGGKEYKEMVHKQKLEIPNETGSDFYFVQAGDLLEWKDGRWQKTTLTGTTPGCPLAKVKTTSGRNLEIEVWDENGFYPQTLRLDPQGAKGSQKNEIQGSSLRLRSSTQVACSIGKRRFILKEGDWLIKVGKSWRNIKRSKEIEDCLQHKVRGELFIFDSIEKQQGKFFLKGHFFDEMRTQMLPISLPIASEDSSSAKGKKGKSSPLFKNKKGRKKNEK